jgi:hypothetical protein
MPVLRLGNCHPVGRSAGCHTDSNRQKKERAKRKMNAGPVSILHGCGGQLQVVTVNLPRPIISFSASHWSLCGHCSTAILAVIGHGQDARVTFGELPLCRRSAGCHTGSIENNNEPPSGFKLAVLIRVQSQRFVIVSNRAVPLPACIYPLIFLSDARPAPLVRGGVAHRVGARLNRLE